VFIDIHTHAALYPVVPMRDGRHFISPDELVATMDQVGIDMAVVLPLVSPSQRNYLLSTEEVLAMCADHPDRLIPFCCLDPRQELYTLESDFTRFLDIYKAHGCKGVGEVTVNLPFDDPLVWNLFEHVEASGLPLIFHVAPQVGGYYGMVDELHLPRLERTLQRFPELPFLGHSQPFWAEISADVTDANRNGYPDGPVVPGGRVPELMRRYLNLYGDLSAGSGFNAISRDPAYGYRFLEEFQGRLLFGTDLLSPGQKLPQIDYLKSAVEEAKITREAFEKITWKNANRLLGLGIGD
jgi:predicted TIM-barrel fold metal-dependent hydrolase